MKTNVDREFLRVTWLDCDTELSSRKNFDAGYVPSSRQESLLEETSMNDGFVVPSQYTPATFATMHKQTRIFMQCQLLLILPLLEQVAYS